MGRPVKLIILDNKSDFSIAKEYYEQLLTKDKVDLIYGPYSSGLTEAMASVVEKYHYPSVASGAVSDRIWEKGYKYVFNNWIYSILDQNFKIL